MIEASSETPIACRPQALTKEQRARSRSLRTELAAAMVETKELPDGYAFRFRVHTDAELFQKSAEWISLERRCCPFLSFELAWPQGDDAQPLLTLRGPAGTKDFLSAEMPELPSSK